MADASESFEEATPEEKLAIAKHFVMHSPNGEVGDVLRDMKTLVGKDLITEEWENSTLARYNKSQFVAAGSGDDLIVQSKYSEIDGGKFINPNSSKAAKVDPKTMKLSDVEEVKLEDEFEDVRAATQKALDDYLKRYFVDNKGYGVVYASGADLSIVITMKNLNLANFWSGGWRSEYSIPVNTEGSVDLNGRVRINVHYFEDGNVQLNTDYRLEKPPGVKVTGDATETGTAIVKAITEIESDFHKKFEEFYMKMSSHTFKGLRRVLPKTGQKMEWRSAVHKIATEMAQ